MWHKESEEPFLVTVFFFLLSELQAAQNDKHIVYWAKNVQQFEFQWALGH